MYSPIPGHEGEEVCTRPYQDTRGRRYVPAHTRTRGGGVLPCQYDDHHNQPAYKYQSNEKEGHDHTDRRSQLPAGPNREAARSNHGRQVRLHPLVTSISSYLAVAMVIKNNNG